MTPINALPYNVVECPEIGCLDVVPIIGGKLAVQITDSWGKRWYLRTIGRDRYDWTRTECFARALSLDTARKHAAIIATIWKKHLEEKETEA